MSQETCKGKNSPVEDVYNMYGPGKNNQDYFSKNKMKYESEG